MDIVGGYEHVRTVIGELVKVCDEANETFCTVYSKAEAMAKTCGNTPSLPLFAEDRPCEIMLKHQM
jgi:hypothetical protein